MPYSASTKPPKKAERDGDGYDYDYSSREGRPGTIVDGPKPLVPQSTHLAESSETSIPSSISPRVCPGSALKDVVLVVARPSAISRQAKNG